MLRFLTAGESHGKGLVGILEGFPKGVNLKEADFEPFLKRRFSGYGRGERKNVERDKVEIISGVRFGKTLGSPITLLIKNLDYPNWLETMASEPSSSGNIETVSLPRPGHADLTGAIKYRTFDIRDIIERASGRETAMRVALSLPARNLLQELGISSAAFVLQIGDRKAEIPENISVRQLEKNLQALGEAFLTPDPKAAKEWQKLIDRAKETGDTLGGIAEIRFEGLPPGIGTFMHWDRRLDARLAFSLMSIPAVRAIEIGEGITLSSMPGSASRDLITYSKKSGYSRKTNFGGGIEGGMTNGNPLVLRCFMKPIPTLRHGKTVELKTHKNKEVRYERSDVVAVAALAVIAESVVALELASGVIEKFGGDTLDDIKASLENFNAQIKAF